jgi:uncharacterized protein YacL
MWEKFYTVASGGLIIIIATIIREIVNSLSIDNSLVSVIGSIVVCIVTFFIMGKVSDNIIKFFKALEKQNEKRG